MKPNGRDIIAHMKKIKAEAQETIAIEQDRLCIERQEKGELSTEERMALWHDLEAMEAKLQAQAINTNPELASCFYKPASDEKKENPSTEALHKQFKTELEQSLEQYQDITKKPFLIWFIGGLLVGALLMFAHLKTLEFVPV